MGYITAREAAELSGYTFQHIARLAREKKVKAQKFSLVWMIDRDSLLQYISNAERSGDGRYGPNK